MVAGEWQAVVVEVNDPRTNKTRKTSASKEIIVSAGTYNTPVILVHSVIEPKEHLSQFHVPVKQHLPGVTYEHSLSDDPRRPFLQEFFRFVNITIDNYITFDDETRVDEIRSGVNSFADFLLDNFFLPPW